VGILAKSLPMAGSLGSAVAGAAPGGHMQTMGITGRPLQAGTCPGQ